MYAMYKQNGCLPSHSVTYDFNSTSSLTHGTKCFFDEILIHVGVQLKEKTQVRKC